MLKRTKEKVLGGVCGGLAKYLGIDVVIIRIVFILLFTITSAPLIPIPLVYIIFWVAMPEE